MVRKNESMLCPTGTGYSGNLYPIFSRENVSRSARRDVFSIASGKSAKIARISRSFFKLREQFADCIKMRVFANTGENIQDFASVRLGILHTVCSDKRKSMRAR